MPTAALLRMLRRGAVLFVASLLALQLAFALRILALRWIDPSSSTFQRSQIVRLLWRDHHLAWSQTWTPLSAMGHALPKAVLASEDAGFFRHAGIDWSAVDKARDRNQSRAAQAAKAGRPVRMAGGSTITQQLAKNLLLSPERTWWRKGQEAVVTLMLEALLEKERILEIYLNTVEWGEGVFGAGAAAEHYYRAPPHRLSAAQAARLAVMLPAPRRFERLPQSPYLQARAATIVARMEAVHWPARRGGKSISPSGEKRDTAG